MIQGVTEHRSPAALLHDDEDPGVPDESKAIFYAHAELEVRYSLRELKHLPIIALSEP
jgi:hypothetical protein